MSERKTKALNVMFNSFPQQQGDAKLRLNTFLHLLSELSDGAVIEAARRFAAGECGREDDQRRFAPSSAEFVHLAKECESQIAARLRPQVSGPVAIKRPASWHRMQEKIARAMEETRRTYQEALKQNPDLVFTDHVMSEFKKATGHDLRIPRPRADAPKARANG